MCVPSQPHAPLAIRAPGDRSGAWGHPKDHREPPVVSRSVVVAASAGRADLVLLLIDTDTLSSEIRFEQSDTASEAFPHVYGPVDLDASFEATSYRPGPDGRFHPHEEASGFDAHGAATLQETARRVLRVMAGFPGAWWVAGGWALDLFLGHKTRPHADVELSVLAADQWALFGHLRGWDLRLAAPGSSLPAWDGSRIQPPFHQVWARRGPVPGCPAGPDEFAADPDHARVSAGAEHHRSLGVPAPPGRHPAAGPGRDHHRRGRGGRASGSTPGATRPSPSAQWQARGLGPTAKGGTVRVRQVMMWQMRSGGHRSGSRVVARSASSPMRIVNSSLDLPVWGKVYGASSTWAVALQRHLAPTRK
jgi:hypothetical protein